MRWVAWFAVSLALALPAAGAIPPVPFAPNQSVFLDQNHDVWILVVAHQGDAWTRLARRLTGSADRWSEIAELNEMDENLVGGRTVRVPLSIVKPEIQSIALRALFPQDEETPEGWKHRIVAGNEIEGEPLWKIAEWFTGAGANYSAIRRANNLPGLSTRRGDTLVIPVALLLPALRPSANRDLSRRGGDPMPRSEAVVPEQVQTVETDAFPGRTGRKPRAADELEENPLTYERSGGESYAVYRLRKDEALYSSVVVRFTGRVYAKDVNQVVGRIVTVNEIEDVARMPVGFRVRIPIDLLTPEYKPLGDLARVERERSKKERALRVRRTEAKNLRGVHVILDAGHGGRDVGTAHGDIWESIYVYDVVCRLKKLLEEKTGATVWITTRSTGNGYEISSRDKLEKKGDHVVLTSPNYELEDATVGVNLRWYLANSIFRRALKKSVEGEKVVFLSIHADSLHSSLRGAMAYVPGEKYVRGSYSKKGSVYLTRSEVQESPKVTQSREEAQVAEGLSEQLAESIMASFERHGLGVHPFSPIRDNVVRDGREWVPAIIRFNKVPTRLLLEICNLGNEQDRKQIRTKKYRQAVAGAIQAGLVDFFAPASDPPRVAEKSEERRVKREE